VLPGVRFACDGYVTLVRESPLVVAVASSLTEFFSPDIMAKRIVAWEQHYPWVDPETMEGPIFDREGLLLVKAASRMAGYLGDPERTAEVVRDGWYVTGDIVSMDEDGFIRVTDRLSRFSKLGGEMVPHIRIEESIGQLLSEPHTCVVTSVPDETRGERLVAFFTDPLMTAPMLWERLCQTDLPRLWLPKREDMHHIEAIPTLGTGKTDLRRVKQLASEVTSSRQAFI
jgi:acyl-[acyl-carrier-protein]-phospholipid O-acyltransferase/long-chain-fatty-acid--[acyl-carrier-protein] ligase